MLKNREHPFPPGGYIFFQPQTGWFSPGGLTFYQVVDEIIKMRQKNPRFADQWSLDRTEVANELDLFTCLRIKNDPNYCDGSNEKKNSPPPRPLPQAFNNSPPPRNAVVAAGERAENFKSGVGAVLDWLGEGMEPVPSALAHQRAKVCAACPENGRPDFIQRIEGWAASGVRELINLKNDLELSTTYDDKLHHCQVCDCAIKLKVFAPMKHILDNTTERVMALFPEHCWIKKEDKL